MTTEENTKRLERISEVLELVCNPGRDHYEMIAEDILSRAEREPGFTPDMVEGYADVLSDRYRRASEKFPVADVDLSEEDWVVKPVQVAFDDDGGESDATRERSVSEGIEAMRDLAEESRQYSGVKPADVKL